MARRNVVRGQKVSDVIAERAKTLRREMTPAEHALWARLRGNRLHDLHFRRQQCLHGFIVDFYCHAASLVIEIDGSIHDETKDADEERDRILKVHGFTMLRLSNAEVIDGIEGTLQRITEACQPKNKLHEVIA